MTQPVQHQMQCMEVWGGNQSVDTSVGLGGLDAWVYSLPYDQASNGGDIHYVSSCASGRITRLMIADVSGHGIEVSDTASSLRKIMRRFVNYIDQRRFVEEMNQYFTKTTKDGRFATALVMSFFNMTRKLTISTAGHPSPLLYRANTAQWEAIDDCSEQGKVSNAPLGVMDSMVYESYRERLNVGDCVLCFTDPLWEACDSTGAQLRTPGLLALVNSIDIQNPGLFIPELLKRVSELHQDNLKNDDVTVLLLRANGERTPWMNTLLSPFRLIKSWFSKN